MTTPSQSSTRPPPTHRDCCVPSRTAPRCESRSACSSPRSCTRSSADDGVRPDRDGRVVRSTFPSGGVVRAIDAGGLVAIAARHDVVVELVPEIGGFVAAGAPLFRVYGGASAVPDDDLQGSILLGDERTSDQDPQLSMRILVDIAIRALSPAVNDPTTAVEALCRIGELLIVLAGSTLPDGVHRDRAGAVRLVQCVPTWDDYLELAFTEIRVYGIGSPFVVRAMRRVLHELRDVAPPDRRPAIDRQLTLFEGGTSVGSADRQ
jgi:uncharacterized membrane protein